MSYPSITKAIKLGEALYNIWDQFHIQWQLYQKRHSSAQDAQKWFIIQHINNQLQELSIWNPSLPLFCPKNCAVVDINQPRFSQFFWLASLLHNKFSHCCEPTPKFLEFIVQLYRQVESSEARLRWWHRSISEAGRENPWSKFLYHPRNQFSVAGESADWRLWYVWIIIQLQHS